MDTPEFGRAMYKYAKRLGKHNHQSQKGKSSEIPESKSDSDIKKTDNLVGCSGCLVFWVNCDF